MGADLYIRSIQQAAQEKYKPKFDEWVAKRDRAKGAEREAAQKKVSWYYDKMYPDKGYFRDSYNDSSLLWILGMSWWHSEFIDEDGEISVEGCRRFLEALEVHRIPRRSQMDWDGWVRGHHVKDEGDGGRKWRKYFVWKRRKLMKFLRTAIELNESVEASV